MSDGYRPDRERIRADVQALCAITRDSAGPGERATAAWAAGRLRELGAEQVTVEPFRARATNSWSFAAHGLAAIAAARTRGPRGALLALAACASLEADVSGRAPWRRRIAGGARGANAVGLFPASEARCATAVLVAHVDAARTGLAWSPRVVQAGAARHLRTRRAPPVMGLQAAGLLAAAAAPFLPGSRVRTLARAIAGLTGAVALAANLDIARSPAVPGANDNASGVAAVLDLAAQLARRPLEHVDVRIALVGCEESGMGGFHAWLARHGGGLDPGASLVVGLDTLGCGTPIVAAAEGAVATHRYRERDLAIVDEGARRAELQAPQRWRIGAWTDPLLALRRGLPAVSLLSIGPGYYPHYHHPSDLPEHVDWDCVGACARIAHGTLEALDARARGDAPGEGARGVVP